FVLTYSDLHCNTFCSPLSLRLHCRLFRHCSGDRRHLRSFPTRRSSDLVRQQAAGRVELTAAIRGDAQRSLAERRAPGIAVTHEQDRKSTRLNSSHVKISYAVFCLKKKKTTHDKYEWKSRK